jgi:hypothetical protein
VLGSSYTFSSSTDGLNFNELNAVTDMRSSALAELYLRAAEKAYIYDIVLTTLDGSGSLDSVTGDLLDSASDWDDFSSLPTELNTVTIDTGIGW